MHENTSRLLATPDRRCNRAQVEHPATEGNGVGNGEELRADRSVPAARLAATFGCRNETVATLERLRKRYKEAGDIAGVKYIANAIRALRRGAE